MRCQRTRFCIDLLNNCEDHLASQKDNAAFPSTAEAAEGCPIGVCSVLITGVGSCNLPRFDTIRGSAVDYNVRCGL
jgi:hypothetical protein